VPDPDRILQLGACAAVVIGALLLGASLVAFAAAPDRPGLSASAVPSRPTTPPKSSAAPPTTTRTTTTTTSAAVTTESPEQPPASRAEQVVAFALAQLGKPYRFAAAGPKSFDCSGLTLAAYATVGIGLPHHSVRQAGLGRAVDWRRDRIEPGDLVFTRGGDPVIDLGHVGIAISASEWVVAPHTGATVRRAPIPRAGIQRVRRLLDS
jgi:cell wall-associated NlpC family hydrolase